MIKKKKNNRKAKLIQKYIKDIYIYIFNKRNPHKTKRNQPLPPKTKQKTKTFNQRQKEDGLLDLLWSFIAWKAHQDDFFLNVIFQNNPLCPYLQRT